MGPEDRPQRPSDIRLYLVDRRTGERTDITEYVTVTGFDPVADRGYIQVPDNEPEDEDLGPCCGYWCLNCPYAEDFDRSITD